MMHQKPHYSQHRPRGCGQNGNCQSGLDSFSFSLNLIQKWIIRRESRINYLCINAVHSRNVKPAWHGDLPLCLPHNPFPVNAKRGHGVCVCCEAQDLAPVLTSSLHLGLPASWNPASSLAGVQCHHPPDYQDEKWVMELTVLGQECGAPLSCQTDHSLTGWSSTLSSTYPEGPNYNIYQKAFINERPGGSVC